MKYPQLVSTRAVNAISDWLVSRLEQLGVEAPLIYSRLLLSLLQSSVQINDPIEFSNLETFLANRKGNSKRYPPCDTDTLRKITAVQCLMEIVSSEQEITKIENLVDELCEKLIDIEKQSTSLEEDDNLHIATTALKSTPNSSSLNKANEEEEAEEEEEELLTTAANAATKETFKTKLSETKALSAVSKKAKQQVASDVEDPFKRYYRAFPALSKEMEDSIGLLRRNTKSLTWPVDRKINLSVKNTTTASSSSNTVVETKSNSGSGKLLSSELALATAEKTICVADGGVSSALLSRSQSGDCNTVLCNTAGVKRKSKRRRNQAMSKGKTTAGNNIRKNSYCGGSSSPTWDTDFEGSWEMGRDLIKEFIVKQNNRNRSTSESAAYNMAIGGCGNSSVGRQNSYENHDDNQQQQQQQPKKSMMNEMKSSVENSSSAVAAAVGAVQKQNQKLITIQNDEQMAKVLADPCVVEVSLCDKKLVENSKSDGNVSSVSDTTEKSLSTARRLYERDISNDSLNEQDFLPDHSNHQDHHHRHHNNHETTSSAALLSEQLDFAQFKAKFNSSVEALWKNSNSSDSMISNINQSMLQSTIDAAVPSIVAERSEDLKNFWTNYYSHCYDIDKFKECFEYSNAGLTSASMIGNLTQSDGQNNYFSMPIQGSSGDDFDKSVGGKRAGGKTSPIGVFLQSTIWSENSNSSYPDTDESFFMKVLNSTSNNQKTQDQLKMDGNGKSYFYPYQASKWSEGINGVPHGSATATQHHYFQQQLQQQQQQQQPLIVTSSSSSSSISTMDHSARSCYTNDFVDSAPSSSSSFLGGNPNWHLSAGNNLQADVKSWSSSNPTTLTELYGGGGSLSAVASLGKKNGCNFDRNVAGGDAVGSSSATTSTCSTITLVNHSATSSGFLAYSRIKSYAKLIDAKPVAKWEKAEVDYRHQLNSSTPPDDENLLTSERTHFHPIKMSYADGHTFEISSNLDTVEFERSDSGYLYLESEKYLEYTRSDVLAEEDSSVSGSHYQTPMRSASRDCNSSVGSTRSSQSEFLIRFRVKNTDQACQTECNVIGSNVMGYQAAATSSSYLPIQTANVHLTNEVGDDDEDEWMDIGCIGGMRSNPKDDAESVSMDQWSMVEITKKCMDNNNASHTLWGMCPACNNEMKSKPANRLLKAELSVEGDEIMSDLRYMQDLYIGSDWEDQNATRDDMDEGDDTDLDAETIRDCEFYQAMATPAGCGDLEEEDQQQKDILYNVNKLIADLLRPENAHTLANALGAVGVGVGCVPNVNCFGMTNGGAYGGVNSGSDGKVAECINDAKYIGGLWNSDENIIWKNPIDIFSRLNNNNNDSFLEKLNWEYSNLAELWGKTSPDRKAVSSADEDDEAKEEHAEAKEYLHVNTSKQANKDHNQVDGHDNEETIKIACKNMKNLLKSSSHAATVPMSPGDENSTLFEINERRLNDSKRMQCFLSSNKFKISNRFDRKRRHSASQNVCSSLNNNNNNNNATYNNNNNLAHDNNNSKLPLHLSDPLSTILLTTTSTKATTKDTHSEYGRNILPCDDNDDHDDDDDVDNDCNDERHYNDNEATDDDDDGNDNDDDGDDEDDQQPNNQKALKQQATIITCKYWTAMQPIGNNSAANFVEGETTDDQLSADVQAAAKSFFIDKNSQFIDGLPSITLNTSSILKHVTLVSRPLTR